MARWDAAPPDYGAMAADSHFSKAEIRRMYQRFQSIAYWPDPQQASDTWLTKEAFMQQSELAFCPMAARAFDVEAEESSTHGYIDFKTYVRIFSHFSPKASADEKRSYLRKLLGGADGKPPTRETYVSYIQGVSPCALMPHVAEKLAEEVWKNLSESFAAGQAFSPTGRYDIDVVMTIPL